MIKTLYFFISKFLQSANCVIEREVFGRFWEYIGYGYRYVFDFGVWAHGFGYFYDYLWLFLPSIHGYFYNQKVIGILNTSG